MGTRPKRPRAARRRTFPDDSISLRDVIHSLHAKLVTKAGHLKKAPHDLRARRGFLTLFNQRAAALTKLHDLDPETWVWVMGELDLTYSTEVQP